MKYEDEKVGSKSAETCVWKLSVEEFWRDEKVSGGIRGGGADSVEEDQRTGLIPMSCWRSGPLTDGAIWLSRWARHPPAVSDEVCWCALWREMPNSHTAWTPNWFLPLRSCATAGDRSCGSIPEVCARRRVKAAAPVVVKERKAGERQAVEEGKVCARAAPTSHFRPRPCFAL